MFKMRTGVLDPVALLPRCYQNATKMRNHVYTRNMWGLYADYPGYLVQKLCQVYLEHHIVRMSPPKHGRFREGGLGTLFSAPLIQKPDRKTTELQLAISALSKAAVRNQNTSTPQYLIDAAEMMYERCGMPVFVFV